MASQQGIVGRPDASRATPAAMTVDDGLIAGLPGYSVVGVLGQGTDSTVYRVVRHGRDYALKLIRRPVGDRANDVMPFRREAALLARIDHPRLPRIHTVGQVAGHAYLVMDFIDGNKLSTLIGSQGMDETQVWSIAHDVAEALIAVHRVGLVHRDVKPDNIIIGPDGGAWLVDFGLARAGACEAGEGVAGTPLYASPEQVGLLRRPVDGRSDLYSLGVTLFELATGAPPFDATDVGQLLREHATQAPPDLRAVRPDRSASLEAVVRRLLAKDPDDRYQTAAGLLADVPGPAASGPEPPAGTSVDDDPAAAISETPFVGREQELASLHALWEETRHGRGKLVLVRGPVGIGKTRLVTQFTTSLSHAGVPVMNARRVASDAAPLSMLRAAVNDYLARLARRPQALRAPALERMALAAAQYSDLIAAVVPDLARLIGLSPPSSGASLGTEHAGEVIAATLIEHARLEGGMVIHLEGCQHLDPATLEALRAMAPCLADSNLMVILALRDGPGGEEALALLRQALDRHIDADLVIDRLRPADIDELLNQYLPGARIDAGQLASRSDGNPLTLIEYLRLIVELGLLQPSWGTWQLDADALDRLDLPQEAFELMERRLGSLTETSQSVLRTAAVLYDGFTCHLLAAVSGLPADTVTQALQDALDTRLLEDEGHGRYGFLHDYTVELLLADLQPETLRHLHQRAGCALEADPAEPDDPPTAFRRAHHYLSGEIGQSPHSMLRACATAGRSAMTADSPADALWFLQRGRDAAISISADVDSEFLALLGRAQRECGLFQDAEATLQNALTSTRDLVLRAEIFGHLARTYVGLLRLDDAIATIRLGLAELGLPTLSAGVAGTVAGVVRALGLMAPAWIGPLIRPVSAKRRARDEIAASLYDVVAQTHIIGLRYGAAALALAAELTLLRRLGRCADLVRVHAALGYCLRMVPGFRTVAWPFRHALRLGAHLRDPRPTAVCLLLDALSGLLSGTQGGQRLSSCLAAQGRWLDIVIFRDALRVLCRYEAYRGNIDAARRWYQEGLARFGQEGTTGLESAAIAIDAVAGQAADADRRLADASASPASQHWLPRLHLATARILAMTERGEIGEPFDQAIADLDSIVDALPADGIRWRRPIRQLLCRPDQPVLVFVAFGRLAQAAGCGLPRTRQLAAAKQAIRRLGRYANTPLLRANHQLALAWLAQLEGNQPRALRRCSRAESWLRTEYAPLAAFEVARLRARVLTDLGQLAAATDQARSALALADAHHWGARRRRISVSFDLSGLTSYHHGPYGPSGPSGTGGDGGSDPSLAGRRLAALQQVSLATCRVLDPDDLVRVTLDETIRIMSAERALLFLSDHHHLRPHLGRDAAGHDLQDVTGFSATLVDHVRDSGEVLVVTGSEEGLALGSASMAAYGLRSIMIAPLSLEGRFLGAVYLDSRVAKGIFTTDDAALLAAIVGHIALALETTRTIQLEQAIHSERERRDIAERLHHAMTALAEPSSPTTVLHRLLEQLLRLLPGEQGWLLCQEGDHFQIVAHRSTQLPSPEAPDPGSLVPADELLTTVLNADQVAQGTAAQASPGGLVGDDRPWIALPVTAGTGQRGVVVLAGAERQTYHRPQIAVAVVLARHGMTAYDNACLINQLRQLATVDELTGAANRHDFFTRATVLFDHAHQQQRPLTVMMIDLDHFKQVNDTYGHQTGDQVLLVTAQRLRSAVRTTDLLCRYGGEEFALVLPNADPADGVVAERIRHSFSAAPIDTDAGPVLITVSIGVTNLAASDHDLRTVLARADTALYQAKASGRNCIVTIREE